MSLTDERLAALEQKHEPRRVGTQPVEYCSHCVEWEKVGPIDETKPAPYPCDVVDLITEIRRLRADISTQEEIHADRLLDIVELQEEIASLRAEAERLREWRELCRAELDEWGHFGCCDGGPHGEPCDIELCRRVREWLGLEARAALTEQEGRSCGNE